MNHISAGKSSFANSGRLKAAVAVPPVLDFYFTRHRFSALGPHILSTLLRENGCDVLFFNFPLQCNRGRQIPLPAAFNYLTPHIIENETGGTSWFSRFQQFGPDFSECARQILSTSPDMVFIPCFAFCYAEAALSLAAAIREIASEIPIIMGGAGVSAYPEFFIHHPAVDFAVTGEAEVSIPAFISAMRAGTKNISKALSRIPNLYQKTRDRIIAPREIRRTTAAEMALMLTKTHETRKNIYFSTSLSRGCTQKCRFCSNFLCHGRAFRTIPAETIKKTLDGFTLPPKATEKTVYINFEDDNLLLAPEYFIKVLAGFRKKFPGIRFLAENGLDYTRLTPELVNTLADMGLQQFNLSIASTHGPILAKENRGAALSHYETVVHMLGKYRVRCITYFICGFKDDTRETVAKNIAFLAKQPTLIGISLFYPVPGLPGFTDKTRFDRVPPALCAGSAAVGWNRSLTTAEMITAFRLCRFVNLLKSTARTPAEDDLIREIIKTRRLHTLIQTNHTQTMIPVPQADIGMVRLFFDQFAEPFTVLPYPCNT